MNFTVQHRENTGKGSNRRLRKQGLAPGVVYGKGEPQIVSMRADYAFRLIQSSKGAQKAIELNVESDGETKNKTVIIQDYQLSNWGNKLLHVDFLEVSDDTVITVEIPVTMLNEEISPAVKTGGVLQTIRRMIPVRCMVKNVPEIIEVDVQDLVFGESIHVLDLEYPEGVTPIVKGRNFTVITVAGRLAEEVEEVEEVEELEEGVEGAEEADDADAEKGEPKKSEESSD
ncbi:MAG: 50S ribosomal protein L25 [Proteobacteria bacterium]|nr:50S ribosomal protein L25 [Pseudomonadota bacterium]